MSEYARELEDDSFARSEEAFSGIVGWLRGAESAQLTHAELEEQLGPGTGRRCGCWSKITWICGRLASSAWSG